MIISLKNEIDGTKVNNYDFGGFII